ncbi:UNKNOWN [Stylonychia lemnae]|uniref:Uncharacterized protein n=1 Tax=Stylonychia lemnae TaxID=5949 RepID=A0A078A8Y3_STYLE|nr:UNKNOWN [Stylonychia lemnae]|eukprot:CDW77263.1 UNKNOWN [Stylonychia lemnae]
MQITFQQNLPVNRATIQSFSMYYHTEHDQVLTSNKGYVIDDEVSKKVEKKETLAQQKEKNRVTEYMILLSADMSNHIGAQSTTLCNRNPKDINSHKLIEVIEVRTDPVEIQIEDQGPGLPNPSQWSQQQNSRKKGSILPKVKQTPKTRF